MAEGLMDIIRDYRAPEQFNPRPWYSRAGDCLFYHFDEAESYADRVDDVVTVYRAFEDDRLVGCQIKGITALIQMFGEFGVEVQEGRAKLAFFFLISNFMDQKPSYDEPKRRNVYGDLLRRAGHEQVELPDRLEEPIC
ncbi:MAG: hypothetical protein WD534_04060 [Phycisphaeraceae bacterium]